MIGFLPRILANCVFLAIATTAPAAPQESPAAKGAADPLLEFPRYEPTLLSDLRSAQAREQVTRAAAAQPGSVQSIPALLSRDQLGEAIAVARAAIEKQPERTAEVVAVLSRNFMAWRTDTASQNRDVARSFVQFARKQAAALPRWQAAEAAYRVVLFDNLVEQRYAKAYYEPLRAFAAEYAGTEAAELVEVDLYVEQVRSVAYAGRLESFETFAFTRKSPCARARALRAYASYQAWGDSRVQLEDPTERFLRVFDLVPRLEDPQFAVCDPKPDVAALISGLSTYNKQFSPKNAERLIAAFTTFALAHFTFDSGDADNRVGYILTSKVPDLYRSKGAPLAEIERYLTELQSQVRFPDAAAYLRADFYIAEARRRPSSSAQSTASNEALLDKAQGLLSAQAASGSDVYNRRALATLAWLHYFRGNFAKARETYMKYASSYAQSPYAWVAATRAGQCAEELDDWRAAAESYLAVALGHPDNAFPLVLGHAYAARAFDALGDFERAKTEYQAAMRGWTSNSARLTYSMDVVRRPVAMSIADVATYRNPFAITHEALASRMAQLTKTTSAPGGAIVEQGRWLVDHGRRTEAAKLLTDFARQYPRSANIPEAQYLAHKARLYDALETLNIEGAANEAAGIAALDALSEEPYDFPVFAAKFTKACVLWKQGKAQEAEALLGDALKERVARQKPQEPVSPLERDVAAIRGLLFTPTGSPVYAAQRGWNAFSWPSAPPPFLVVSADTHVRTADGPTTIVTLYQHFAGLPNVLLVSGEELPFFGDLMNKVGGTKKRDAQMDVQKALQTGVMETPNQPIGPSVDLMMLANKFFPMRPGHWGGWEFLTYPDITLIEFTDAVRAKALAHVTIGYSGCVLLLEKVDGVWKPVRITSTWVT